MKFPVHSSRPALVYACALSLFPTLAWAQHYQQTNLVSNVPVTPAASVTDPNLQNAWGLVHGPTSPWWIANNAGGTSTLYNTSGLKPGEPCGANPGSGPGASDDRCTQCPRGDAGEWRQDPKCPRPAVFRIAHLGHVQREPDGFPSRPRRSRNFSVRNRRRHYPGLEPRCQCNHCGH